MSGRTQRRSRLDRLVEPGRCRRPVVARADHVLPGDRGRRWERSPVEFLKLVASEGWSKVDMREFPMTGD